MTRTVEGASITFAETEHDYGTMKIGADGTYDFVIQNNGSEPLFLIM
jgi:VCBS repeat-containing protein